MAMSKVTSDAALSTHRVCVPEPEKFPSLPKRFVCPGGCAPGTCLNAQCFNRIRDPGFYGKQELTEEDKLHKQCLQYAMKVQQKKEREEFLARERKRMGMKEPDEKEKDKPCLYGKHVKEKEINKYFKEVCPPISLKQLKDAEGRKTMRVPARPLCQLEVPSFTPPTDDYTELSRFLRVSTMPGYSHNDPVSECHDSYNMATWNNRKEIDKQMYKMKRDWLSMWGESNVIEQRWRKAWVEKFGAGAVKK